jgi:uncharacterized protein (TIGR03118 family)
MRPTQFSRFASTLAACLLVLICASSTAMAQRFDQVNLVSNVAGAAAFKDEKLVNAWGMSFSPTGPWWISDAETGVATIYRGDGSALTNPDGSQFFVTVPTAEGGTPPSNPTGQVFNSTPDFVVSKDGVSGAALFIFATENGTISGWNRTVDPANAVRMVDNSKLGANYKGLAIGQTKKGNFIYATNFHDGVVEMYDGTFQLVKTFTDDCLPEGYAPFGIRNLGGKLYVTFAKQDEDKEDDVAGRGHGFVDVFDLNGRHGHRLLSRGKLNSPWGLEIAPDGFGRFSGDLLVGNFGDGRIHAYDLKHGKFDGTLRGRHHKAIEIDGLWAISFGNGGLAGATDELFFTAGPNEEEDGLFGKLVRSKH